MILKRIDDGRGQPIPGQRMDGEAVRTIVRRDAHLSQKRRQGGKAIGLVAADVGQVFQAYRLVGEDGQHRQGWGHFLQGAQVEGKAAPERQAAAAGQDAVRRDRD